MMFHFSLKIQYYPKKKGGLYFYAMKKLDGFQEEDNPLYGVQYLPYDLC